MKTNLKRAAVLLTSAVMILTYTACGSAVEKTSSAYVDRGSEDMAAETVTETYNSSMGSASNYDYSNEAYPEEAKGEYDQTSDDTAEATGNFVIESDKKLIYTCDITMETTEFDSSVSALRELISKYEGYIESEEQSDDAWNWYYSDYVKRNGTMCEYMTIRIPTSNYDAFMNDLSGSGRIRSKSQRISDITKSYRNTETTIKTLETEQSRLLSMMEQCTTIEEMISVEDRLSDVENELALYRSNLNQMDEDVDYSTICLTLNEVLEYTPGEIPVKTNTFLDRVRNALTGSVKNVGNFLESLLIALIYALPILVILGAIGFVIFLIVRAIVKSAKKNRKKKAERVPNPDAEPDAQNHSEPKA